MDLQIRAVTAAIMRKLDTASDFFARLVKGDRVKVDVGDVNIGKMPKTEVFGEVKTDVKIPDKMDVRIVNTQDIKSEIEELRLDKKQFGLMTGFLRNLGTDVEKLAKKDTNIVVNVPKQKAEKVQKLPVNADPDRYMNVRLTDGKDFWRIFGGPSGGGSSFPTDTKQDIKDILSAVRQILAGMGSSAIDYEPVGTKIVGDYTYFGFKQNGGTNWKVMRGKDDLFSYCYGTEGWTDAWADPTVLSFDDPPDE